MNKSRSEPIRVNTVEAKNNLNQLINQVESTQNPIIIMKRGEPTVALISYDALTEYEKRKKTGSTERHLGELRAYWKSMEERYPTGTGNDSVSILRKIRNERS